MIWLNPPVFSMERCWLIQNLTNWELLPFPPFPLKKNPKPKTWRHCCVVLWGSWTTVLSYSVSWCSLLSTALEVPFCESSSEGTILINRKDHRKHYQGLWCMKDEGDKKVFELFTEVMFPNHLFLSSQMLISSLSLGIFSERWKLNVQMPNSRFIKAMLKPLDLTEKQVWWGLIWFIEQELTRPDP